MSVFPSVERLVAYRYRVIAERDPEAFEKILMNADVDGWNVVGFSTQRDALVALMRKPDAIEAPTIGDVLAEHDIDPGDGRPNT